MTASKNLAELNFIVKDNNETLHKIEKALYGECGENKPGLLTDFILLKNSVEKHHAEYEKRLAERKLNWQWIITAIIAIASVVSNFIK